MVADFQEWQSNRAGKRRRTQGGAGRSEDLDELEERVRSLVQATRVAEGAQVGVTLPLPPKDLKRLTEALSCVMCKGPVQKPVVSSCCQSLLGCKACLDSWWAGSSGCPKCNSEQGREGRLDLKGLDDIFAMLLPITGALDS
ncbi:PREDICTED: uncharacterized protein LOC106815315 [Priapulus caudatus]|uniref:Uncharacterized protein LOC106815315 n=1 Tax=Priapulus caudatus TaxID=37621 RepID=A0ABM1ESS4_PRICU|nr:PREDICTED: uncharacterized protein LOC106815315 [Priapulus caudatus]